MTFLLKKSISGCHISIFIISLSRSDKEIEATFELRNILCIKRETHAVKVL